MAVNLQVQCEKVKVKDSLTVNVKIKMLYKYKESPFGARQQIHSKEYNKVQRLKYVHTHIYTHSQ